MAAKLDSIDLCGRKVDFRLISSKSARKLRVRVGVSGVEVVLPARRGDDEVNTFLRSNEAWIVEQLERVERFRKVRRARTSRADEILYRGVPTPVEIKDVTHRKGANRVALAEGRILIVRGRTSRTPPLRSLENWLRKQARIEIVRQLEALAVRLNRSPGKVYVMGQRTKWGNCSSLHNLSFNWRLIMAPDHVLRYLVVHEAVHLAVPDHSRKFWLTVQSICPEAEKAKQWLSAHGHSLFSNHIPSELGKPQTITSRA
jgi:predicted metal-dependent hydrolase